MKFPERPNDVPKEHRPSSNDNRVNPCESKPSQLEKNVPEAEPQKVSDSRYHLSNSVLIGERKMLCNVLY